MPDEIRVGDMSTGRRPTLVQVCNVGEVVGGTGACAWTVTRALPNWRHVVAFPRGARPEVVREFAPAEVRAWPVVTAERVSAEGAGVVLLHNTSAERVKGSLPAVVLQYMHSRIRAAGADLRMYCSEWLARECGGSSADVLHQAVPEPPRWEPLRWKEAESRGLRRELVVGRLCTPTRMKWPDEVVHFTGEVARRVPGVRWEFVGCPRELESGLRTVCGEAVFHPANWSARGHLWRWDAQMYHHPTLAESFGRVVAEGLRAGCIPVVDARGGFVEQVTAETGFLCASVDEFTQALVRLRDDRALRWQMSHAARERGRRLFGEEVFATKLLARIRQAAARVAESA